MAYAMGVLILAAAWWQMLKIDAPPSGARLLIASYLVGQFAKYLPGNVFQYVARHGLGAAAGASHSALITAAVAEVYLLLCCGAAVALAAAAPTLGAAIPALGGVSRWLALLPLCAILGISLAGRVRPHVRWVPHVPAGIALIVSCCYVVFFLLFGALYFVCLAWVNGTSPAFVPSIGAAATAWVAGFVIPGPPAGAGVREAALTLGVGTQFPAAGVATSILMFRIMTLCGDFLAFLGGSMMGMRLQTTTRPPASNLDIRA